MKEIVKNIDFINEMYFIYQSIYINYIYVGLRFKLQTLHLFIFKVNFFSC